MSQKDWPIRVAVGKVGLDGHDRGLKIIARALRDAGMEAVYLGMRLTPDAVAAAAQEEDVDVVGISLLSGAHMRLMSKVVKALETRGVKERVLLVVGGTIPDSDVKPLQEIGVDGVFPVGATMADIVDFINARANPQPPTPDP